MKNQKVHCMNCNSLQSEKAIKYLGDSKWVCPNCEKKPKKINGICPKCNYQICRCRNIDYENKFRKYLFKSDWETHKKICDNLNVVESTEETRRARK